MNNDKFKIEINIKEESDLYNLFDKYNKTLSEDFISYIDAKAELSNIKDKIQIEIISDKDIDKELLKNTFIEYYDEQIVLINREAKLNRTKQIWLFVIGIIFIAISLTLNNISNTIILEIISTIGSFSIWESANSWLLESKYIKVRKLKMIKLKNSNIVFKSE